MKISILLTTCKFTVLKPCIESILKNTNFKEADAEVIVAMNGCEEEAFDYVRSHGFRFIWVDRRIGAVAAYNLAAQVSDGEYLVKMDDDVIILDWGANNQWLNLLLEPYLKEQNVGQTGVWKDKTWGDYFELHGFITMTPKKVWDELGGLDMAFNPGCGDDADYSIRVQKAGYKLVEWPPTAIINGKRTMFYPAIHISIGEYFENSTQRKIELVTRNREILEERYGLPTDPECFERMNMHKKEIDRLREKLLNNV